MSRSRAIGIWAASLVVGSASAAGRSPQASYRPSLPTANRGGTVVVKVTDYDPARDKVLEAALQQGAELLDAHTQVNFEGRKLGWLRFRMASDRLPLLLPAVHAVGKLYSEHLVTGDHRSEVEELERRTGRLREHEQRLDALLRSPRHLRGSDVLYLQERLFRAGVDEGELLQRRVDLERAAKVGTLTVELFEPEPRRVMDLGNWYAGAMLRARTALYRDLARGMTVGAYTMAFAPIWIPGLALAVLLGRWLWRRGRLLAVRLATTAGLMAARAATAVALLASEVVARRAARVNHTRSSEPGSG